jgi:hypothetical protein
MAGFPETDIDDEEWEDSEDEREYSRHRNSRWEPQDDEVESMVDYTDCDED